MYNAGRNYVVGVYSGEETEPVEACINAWKELQKRKEPKFDYKVTTALTADEYEEVHLGDTVHVVDYGYTPPLFLQARVGKLELSFTDRTQNSCTLTNYKEIKSKLLSPEYTGLTGTITDIVNTFFPITSEGIADGAITDGKIDTVYYQQITADIISAGIGVFEDLYAKNMTVINADIENLKANNAEINNLKAKYAEIDTLVNGHLTSDNIQSMIITGDKFTVADAFIKDAMIDTISANKINTGTINTNNVQIQSSDGSMVLNGNTQQFKDKNGKVRIQIGKDAQGEFTFALFSQDGQGVLIDETGIKEGAISDGLIVDDMVADNANIAGSKLDINSVITSINNGTTTINSNRIYLDEEGQSLKVAFDRLKTKVETIEDVTIDGDLSSVIEQVTSNTTNINIMQGEISSLISNTTITKQNGEVIQLKDDYNSTKTTVDSIVTKIGSLETNYKNVLISTTTQYYLSTSLTSLAGGSWQDTAPQWTEGKYMWQRMKYVYTDTTTYSNPVCIAGAKGEKGEDGSAGSDGKGIKSITNYYLATNLSSGVTTATSGWTTTVQNVTATKKYLWNCEGVTYTDDSISTTKPCIIGAYGDKGDTGDTGATGADGVGISSITEYYQVSTSNTTAPTSWETTPPTLSKVNKYLWNYERIDYTDGTAKATDMRVIGVYGDTGATGATGATGDKGQSLVSSTPQWYLSSSNTTQSGGSWVETMPTVTEGKYIWLRYKLVWQNPSSTTYTTPTLEQIAESVKEVKSKQVSIETDLGAFKTTVSQTYATKGEVTELGSTYVTQTEFEQTSEDFTFKISQTGGGNLLRNSSFYDADLGKWDYWTFWGTCSQYTDLILLYESFPNSMIIKNTSYSSQGGLYQSNISVQPNTVYTYSANVSWGTTIRGIDMGVEYYNSSLDMVGSTVLSSTDSTLKNTTERQSITFTTPADCSYVTVTFNHLGVSSTSSPFLIIQRPCLVEGHSAVWVPHSDELYDGIVKIDKNGLTVKQGESKSVLDSEALKFYEGSTPYSKVQDGQLTYTNSAGNDVGRIGRNCWKEDNNIWVSHIGAEYQCDITIGAKSSSSQDHYPTNFVVAGGHHDVGTTAVYYNGVNIVYPTMASIMKFRPSVASYMDWDSTKEVYKGDGEIFAYRDSNSLKCLGVSGRNKLILGTHPSSTNKEIFSIYTNSSGSNYIDAYAPLNMHGYSVANLTARNSLSARSTYSSTLMDSGTNEYLTHNSMSYGEGEVRWCWRETVFTYAECDVDPATDEWIYTGRNICYIELPIFMAENIQNDYHINVSKMSWGDYRIIEKTPYYFILESQEEDFAFTFEVVAKLIDGETTDSNAVVANGGMYEFSVEEEQEGARVYLDDIQENIITGEE